MSNYNSPQMMNLNLNSFQNSSNFIPQVTIPNLNIPKLNSPQTNFQNSFQSVIPNQSSSINMSTPQFAIPNLPSPQINIPNMNSYSSPQINIPNLLSQLNIPSLPTFQSVVPNQVQTQQNVVQEDESLENINEQTIQPLDESQRPTAYVTRIRNVESNDVPQEVLEYRRLSKEERSLRMRNPRATTLMAIRCTGCGKPIDQLRIENELQSDKKLRQVLDDNDYIRMCCRKQIENEPVVNNILKSKRQDQQTQRLMNNLTLQSTAASITNRVPQNQTIGSNNGIMIINEAPPGLVQEGIRITGLNFGESTQGQRDICFAGPTESFVDIPTQTGDAFDIFMNQLETNNDEYDD